MGGKEQKIGQLVLDGQMYRTKFGDETLFFRHAKKDSDLAENKEWTKYTPKWCPFLQMMM